MVLRASGAGRRVQAGTVMRALKWLGLALVLPPLVAVVLIALFGWNWARAPLQRLVLEKTGRTLVIAGDLDLALAWPAPLVRAKALTFANPRWAKEAQMVAADSVEFSVNLAQLLRGKLAFPQVRVVRPVVFLELAPDGRKTWLLDIDQSDENARIPIGRLTLDHGRLGYDDERAGTRIRAELSTTATVAAAGEIVGVEFRATGQYKGLALTASGSGGPLLSLQDQNAPYPLVLEGTIGQTSIKASGNVTSLTRFVAAELHLALHGDSLAQLFPLTGLVAPETGPYSLSGHLMYSGLVWRYEDFKGRVGKSDLAGTLQVDLDGARPFMHGRVVSQALDLADLGPSIGATKKAAPRATASLSRTRVLPDMPFKAERWSHVDADVILKARAFSGATALPLDNLSARIRLRDAVLTLDPLDFGLAGGHLKANIVLDGKAAPIKARASVSARQIELARLLPSVEMARSSKGQINGEIELAGRGDSIGRMLATADGNVRLAVGNGLISRLMMEKAGLHLIEILQLQVTGDNAVRLRCAVADFQVRGGVMDTRLLVLDTDVSTITGSGSIDLSRERLDLTLVPRSRKISLAALRSPIHLTGPFAKPRISVDTAAVATRTIGALLLAVVNPLMALIPLIETGSAGSDGCMPVLARNEAAR